MTDATHELPARIADSLRHSIRMRRRTRLATDAIGTDYWPGGEPYVRLDELIGATPATARSVRFACERLLSTHRFYVVYDPASPDNHALRAKTPGGLAEWWGRSWHRFSSPPLIVDVTDWLMSELRESEALEHSDGPEQLSGPGLPPRAAAPSGSSDRGTRWPS